MARVQGQTSAHVLFWKPADVADDWVKTDLWREAAAIPGVEVSVDEGGVEAARFRAYASGQTILYDAQGHLLFNGGITGARGHAGDNAGRSAVVSLLTTGAAERRETFVFGCALHNPAAQGREGEGLWKK